MIRVAEIKDALRIAEIHVSSWKYAYSQIMPVHILQNLSVFKKEAMWKKIIQNKTKNILVYDEPKLGIVGWIVFGYSRDHFPSHIGEIEAFYIDPNHLQHGYGKALFERAVLEFKKMNYTKVYLWVLAANYNAIIFYKKWGC